MKLVDETIQAYDYDLPEALIAQHPSPERDSDRLMVLNRQTREIRHYRFQDLPGLLKEGDLVVINDTRVFPARLKGQKATGGRIELLLVSKEQGEEGVWRCMAKRVARMKPGGKLYFQEGVEGRILEIEGGTVKVAFTPPLFEALLKVIGEIPIPPYIHRPSGPSEEDVRRYQTIFARKTGAVAAPTAGLHFSQNVLKDLRERGIEVTALTLHVGPGTFLPIRESRISAHRMHEEFYEVSEDAAHRINLAKEEGRRVIAVGTTVVRTLESAVKEGRVQAGPGRTSLFIYPPYTFQVVDGLVTNFHLPKSTLLLLVCSFADKELVFRAYEVAKEKGYRFYSYGDAMLIL